MYEGLASYFLPTGVLEYFEVTDFCEVPTQDTEVLYTTELHIYLDERDNRTPDMSGSVSDGLVTSHVFWISRHATRRQSSMYADVAGQCQTAQPNQWISTRRYS
jgi:hypothetical protein